jgi:leader peptidase (prepilin peptidase) / N-methyltransferase
LAVGAGWALSVHQLGWTFEALRVAVFGTVLLGIAITDLRHYLIPDGFTLFGLGWTIATAMIAFVLAGDPAATLFAQPMDAIVGACAGAGLIAIIGWLGEVAMRREAMGMGDVTLMAFAGAALGPSRALLTVFVGATLAMAVLLLALPVMLTRRGRTSAQTELPLGPVPFEVPPVPFGVFLAPAALATLLWGDALMRWIVAG